MTDALPKFPKIGRSAMGALAVVVVLAMPCGATAQTGSVPQPGAPTHVGGPLHGGAPGHGHGSHSDLFIAVPLEGPTPGVVFPFGGSHHQVPGVVAVDRAPYVCTPHQLEFHDRAAFVAHLRRRHGLDDADIPHAVLVQGGQVRYVGD